ncbi:IclR family transcriptional regulator [Niallia sp. Krafla_26]|uniref:IclR family transcriptional regulator n=1 Tax=Niallia sp. Krafla_26 TaxID=3064703 RepID=UPI003D1677A7
MTKDYTVQTVQNAIRILRLFTIGKPDWTLSEIAREQNMSVSTTKRLLQTLEKYGYIARKKDSKKYRLSLSILSLSGIVTNTMDLHKEAQSILMKLQQDYGEAIHIGVLEGTETVYLDKVESLNPVRLASFIGKNNPAYCSGCGKVLLAFKNQKEQEKIIGAIEQEGYHPYGLNTVKNTQELMDKLKLIKKQGFEVCKDELSTGITSIAAPIYDYDESVIAAISITGPNSRMNIPDMIEGVVKAAREISRKLGYMY